MCGMTDLGSLPPVSQVVVGATQASTVKGLLAVLEGNGKVGVLAQGSPNNAILCP